MSNDNDPPGERSRERNDRDDYDDDRPRRRDRDYDERPRRPNRDDADRPAASNGLANASLVLGVLALLLTLVGIAFIVGGDSDSWAAMLGALTMCVSGLIGLPAIICGGIGMTRRVRRGAATCGLLLGIFGVFAGISGFGYSLFESVGKVRQAAARMQDQNNLKQIGIALHAQHDSTLGMHAPYAQDFTGKVNTDLSWRVGILPYIEQQSLYNSFDLMQPWDSAKNKSLSNTPIRTYTSPFDGPEPSVNTPYRVFYGGGAMFNEDGKPVRWTDVTDGLSNTIMAAGAVEQVPWAQPRELKYDPNGPLPKLGHAKLRRGFQVLMADGSARFVSDKVSETTLRRLITRAEGQDPGADWND